MESKIAVFSEFSEFKGGVHTITEPICQGIGEGGEAITEDTAIELEFSAPNEQGAGRATLAKTYADCIVQPENSPNGIFDSFKAVLDEDGTVKLTKEQWVRVQRSAGGVVLTLIEYYEGYHDTHEKHAKVTVQLKKLREEKDGVICNYTTLRLCNKVIDYDRLDNHVDLEAAYELQDGLFVVIDISSGSYQLFESQAEARAASTQVFKANEKLRKRQQQNRKSRQRQKLRAGKQ
jgi:hypothetical protein